GLRYKLVGGFSFYNRAEVKDALAYVRLAMHPEDDISLLRVLNVPPRGIGKTTVDVLRETARVDGISIWAAVENFVFDTAPGRAGLALPCTAPRAWNSIMCSLRAWKRAFARTAGPLPKKKESKRNVASFTSE